jgi:hypothetical protein
LLFINRVGCGRNLTNLRELQAAVDVFVRSRCVSSHATLVFERHSFRQQARAVHRSDILIGSAGQALAWMPFLPKGGMVLEFPVIIPDHSNDVYRCKAAWHEGLTHYSLWPRVVPPGPGCDEWSRTSGSDSQWNQTIAVPVDRFVDLLSAILWQRFGRPRPGDEAEASRWRILERNHRDARFDPDSVKDIDSFAE